MTFIKFKWDNVLVLYKNKNKYIVNLMYYFYRIVIEQLTSKRVVFSYSFIIFDKIYFFFFEGEEGSLIV